MDLNCGDLAEKFEIKLGKKYQKWPEETSWTPHIKCLLECIGDEFYGLRTRYEFKNHDVCWMDDKGNIEAAFEYEDDPREPNQVVAEVRKLKNLGEALKCVIFWVGEKGEKWRNI